MVLTTADTSTHPCFRQTDGPPPQLRVQQKRKRGELRGSQDFWRVTTVSVRPAKQPSLISLLSRIFTFFKNGLQCLLSTTKYLWILEVTTCPISEYLTMWLLTHSLAATCTGCQLVFRPPIPTASPSRPPRDALAERMNALTILVTVKHSLWYDSFKWNPN